MLSTQRGMTMIEVIIVMTIVGIASAALLYALTDQLVITGKIESTREASRAGNTVIEFLGNDLRSATAPDRINENAPTKQQLRDVLMYGGTSAYDYHDITYAAAREIWMYADVIPEPEGVEPVSECVGYFVSGASSSLVREVRTSATPCPTATSTNATAGSTLERAVLIRDMRALTSTPSLSLFEYELIYNRSALGKPDDRVVLDLNNAAAGGDHCVGPLKYVPTNDGNATPPGLYSTGATRAVDWHGLIASVRVNLEAFATAAGAASGVDLDDTIGIRSRQASDYQFAVGCAT